MNRSWEPFSANDSDLLSKMLENGLSRTTLYIGPNMTPYVVDTAACRQTNALTRFRRQIRMLPNPSFTSSTPSSTISAIDLLINSSHLFKHPDDDPCAICLDPFDDTYGEAHRLPQCEGHGFHKDCIRGALQASGRCPLCLKMYIIQEGTQPSNGSMGSRIVPPGTVPLDGHGGVGTIIMCVLPCIVFLSSYACLFSPSADITSLMGHKRPTIHTLVDPSEGPPERPTCLTHQREEKCWSSSICASNTSLSSPWAHL